MQKRLSFFFILLVLLLCVASIFFLFSSSREPANLSQESLRVAASFYPVAEFARAVGGDVIEVSTITPPGVEPHEFEPSPRDVAKVYDARVFLYNGGGVDAWAEKIAPHLLGRDIATLEISAQADRTPEADGTFDPHVWLSPVLAAEEVEAVRDLFLELDPAHAKIYQKNTTAYLEELHTLDAEYRSGLAACGKHVVVSSHDALGYVAREYGFTVRSISGLSPEEEPSAGTLSELADLIRAEDIQYVFFETLANPALAQTLAEETGAEPLVFNPLEGVTTEEEQRGETYLTLMRQNLLQLRKALVCR